MATTVFDPSEGPSADQQAAEAAALEQGEKIAQMQDEDRARKYAEAEASNEEAQLIAGKFKSQDDLVRAYEELQKKLGNTETGEVEEPSEEQEEAVEEEPVEESPHAETVEYLTQLGKEFDTSGDLSEEAVTKLSEMDSKELIQAYLAYSTQAKTATLQQAEVNKIMDLAGGAEQYADMIQWAAANLPEQEVADFNAVTATNNPAAIRFAVQSLSGKYRGEVGFEADLVSGKGDRTAEKGFRSHAELSRAIADPRYSRDPAYRQDVEQKLARSKNLL